MSICLVKLWSRTGNQMRDNAKDKWLSEREVSCFAVPHWEWPACKICSQGHSALQWAQFWHTCTTHCSLYSKHSGSWSSLGNIVIVPFTFGKYCNIYIKCIFIIYILFVMRFTLYHRNYVALFRNSGIAEATPWPHPGRHLRFPLSWERLTGGYVGCDLTWP